MAIRSYRRELLNRDLEDAMIYVTGDVLDIGGGRGTFECPPNTNLTILDVNPDYSPNVVADAQNLPIKTAIIDCVKCTELLEHVEYPETVIKEITRILKPGGSLILSVPFNFGIHGDPHDFHRFTDYKLNRMLETDFKVETLKKQGLYFTVLCYMIKQNILNIKSRIRRVMYLTFPLLDLATKLDKTNFVKNSRFMSSFTTGYFVLAVKRRDTANEN